MSSENIYHFFLISAKFVSGSRAQGLSTSIDKIKQRLQVAPKHVSNGRGGQKIINKNTAAVNTRKEDISNLRGAWRRSNGGTNRGGLKTRNDNLEAVARRRSEAEGIRERLRMSSGAGRTASGSSRGSIFPDTDSNGNKYIGSQKIDGYITGKAKQREGLQSNEKHFTYKHNPAPGKSSGTNTDVYTIKGERIPPWYLKEKK